MKFKNQLFVLFAYIIIGLTVSGWFYFRPRHYSYQNPIYTKVYLRNKPKDYYIDQTDYTNLYKSLIITLVGGVLIGGFILLNKKK